VLKYAIKNRQPQRRSAFTYCEDELPARIDFDKSMEDHSQQNWWKLSKHLWLLPMAIIGRVLAGGLFIADFLQWKVYNATTLNTS
jgi:hypothetical protein